MERTHFLPNFKEKSHKSKTYFDYSLVTYLSADINYTKVHFLNGSSQIHSYTMKHFEKYLANNQDFIRIHRGYLVNRKYITELSDMEVMMCCGKRLPVARRRKVN